MKGSNEDEKKKKEKETSISKLLVEINYEISRIEKNHKERLDKAIERIRKAGA